MLRANTLAVLIAGATALPATAQDDDLPIAIQMFTLRDYGSFEEQLQAVADAGVSYIETFGMGDRDADEVQTMLDEHGIEVISDHVSIDRLRDDLDSVVEFNRALGNDTIVMPYLAEDMRPQDADGWRTLGEELGGIAAQLAEEDMRLGYHNHDFEMVEYDGRTAMEILFEAAGDDLVAEVDLAWVDRGGQDPEAFLETMGDSVFAVHAKDNAEDVESAEEGGFEEVGAGRLDWDTILTTADSVGVEWYIIEHDQPAEPAQSVATSAEYLRGALPDVLSGD